jgi:hypothetical protein
LFFVLNFCNVSAYVVVDDDDDDSVHDNICLISKSKKYIVHEIIEIIVMKLNSVWPQALLVLEKVCV